MKKILPIFFLCLTCFCFSQENKTLTFNFDSTKVYINYYDIFPVLKKRNKKLVDVCRQTKKDTLVFDGTTLFLGKHNDSLIIEPDYELFTLIDQRKAKLMYKGQTITHFYTKKVKLVKDGKKYFVGIYYYDEVSKKHFITRVLYHDLHPVPFPHF